jgi:hypothetical protein
MIICHWGLDPVKKWDPNKDDMTKEMPFSDVSPVPTSHDAQAPITPPHSGLGSGLTIVYRHPEMLPMEAGRAYL